MLWKRMLFTLKVLRFTDCNKNDFKKLSMDENCIYLYIYVTISSILAANLNYYQQIAFVILVCICIFVDI